MKIKYRSLFEKRRSLLGVDITRRNAIPARAGCTASQRELVAVERDAVLVQDDAAQPDAGAEPHAPAGAVGRLDVLVLA